VEPFGHQGKRKTAGEILDVGALGVCFRRKPLDDCTRKPFVDLAMSRHGLRMTCNHITVNVMATASTNKYAALIRKTANQVQPLHAS